ncbi:MAG TPA: NAD(P)/FAD-dependent oxidoreductase [Rhodocyclaceae bacterium]|nr:NAD(P)/FAD-dependent oxidoreductase [Rhodocyclaceae bacterium]
MESIDAIVIGAGAVGLACARALALRGCETLILEQHDAFGTETSARNSEVIHAGLYYPTDSLRARLCVEGNRLIYDFCALHGIPHRCCGKLIVATTQEQEAKLLQLLAQGQANGVTGLQMLTAAEAKQLEPDLHCTAALLSASTGILDSHGLMLAVLGEAERHGALLALRSPLRRGRIGSQGIELEAGGASAGEAETTQLRAPIVINAAGLSAQQVAARIEGFPAHCVPPSHWAKGNYYAHTGRTPFSHLIYPVPEPGGLGVHLTLDLGGQARFGPDVEWTDQLEYSVDPQRADRFYAQVRSYWPQLRDGALTPAFCGIRPKITGPGEEAADFLIQGPADHGVPGLVNLFGIESPGLTSSLAIGEYVASLVA